MRRGPTNLTAAWFICLESTGSFEICQSHQSIMVKETMTDRFPDWEFDDEFDGGEETCGRVIVNLHLYIRDLTPGSRILVISRDPGAPVELPAWCRMTKNELKQVQHPYYLIILKPEELRRES